MEFTEDLTNSMKPVPHTVPPAGSRSLNAQRRISKKELLPQMENELRLNEASLIRAWFFDSYSYISTQYRKAHE